MKRLLDDLPSTLRLEKREEIGHVSTGAGQLARPAGDVKPNHGDGFENIHAHHAGLNLVSRTILIDPVEKERSSDRELISRVSEE